MSPRHLAYGLHAVRALLQHEPAAIARRLYGLPSPGSAGAQFS